ncbi:MAG: SEC-C metal-binding domain-containing protein [Akkermansiaceae bacterium]
MMARFVRDVGIQDLISSALPPESVGRNQPCPCGSGRKFKKCCG